MNPKDMTNEELVKNHADARAFAENSDYDLARNGALKVSEDCASELLHRLDEADALRKENEELRNLLGECPKRNNRLGTYSDAKPVQIDVCKLICMAKESEASHD